MPLTRMINNFGKNFDVLRDNVVVGHVKGIYDDEKCIVSFNPTTDIKVGDTINSEYGESYLIVNRQILTKNGKPHHIEAKCKDQNEIQPQTSSPVFNIGTVNNSVIGTYNIVNVTAAIDSIKAQIQEKGGEDKESLNEVVGLLEQILNNQTPVKQGMFSKFSEVMERHSWITSAISSAFIGFLIK